MISANNTYASLEGNQPAKKSSLSSGKNSKVDLAELAKKMLQQEEIDERREEALFDKMSSAEQKEYLKASSIHMKRMNDILLTNEEKKWQAEKFDKKSMRKLLQN